MTNPITAPITTIAEGGPGSGNYGHKGRPGQRGGNILTVLREGDMSELTREQLEVLVNRMASEGLFEAYTFVCEECGQSYATHQGIATQVAGCPFCGAALTEAEVVSLGEMADELAQPGIIIVAEADPEEPPWKKKAPQKDDEADEADDETEPEGEPESEPESEPETEPETEPEVEDESEDEDEDEDEDDEEDKPAAEAVVTPAGGNPEIAFLSESSDGPTELHETARIVEAVPVSNDGNRRGPIAITIEFIRPGWGNKRDNFYYSKEMLRENAGKFVGSKMFLSQHKEDEHNTRNNVAYIKAITGFGADGAPQAKTVVFDPDMAERVRNMQDAGALDQLETSIYARGTKRPATVDGRRGYLVETILDDPKPRVDFVAYGAAGGRAIGLAEAQPVESGTEVLTKDMVRAILARSNAQAAISERLLEREFASEVELQEALSAERKYVAASLGSGRPVGLGDSSSPRRGTDRKGLEARLNEVDARFGLRPASTLTD